jgi:hypothetical protein
MESTPSDIAPLTLISITNNTENEQWVDPCSTPESIMDMTLCLQVQCLGQNQRGIETFSQSSSPTNKFLHPPSTSSKLHLLQITKWATHRPLTASIPSNSGNTNP